MATGPALPLAPTGLARRRSVGPEAWPRPGLGLPRRRRVAPACGRFRRTASCSFRPPLAEASVLLLVFRVLALGTAPAPAHILCHHKCSRPSRARLSRGVGGGWRVGWGRGGDGGVRTGDRGWGWGWGQRVSHGRQAAEMRGHWVMEESASRPRLWTRSAPLSGDGGRAVDLPLGLKQACHTLGIVFGGHLPSAFVTTARRGESWF